VSQTPIRYPEELERYNVGIIRSFTDEVRAKAEELVAVMKANNLSALSAVQIGYPWQMLAIQDGETYRVLTNPRIIRHENKMPTEEKTDYFPDYTFHLERFGMISLMYDDLNGEAQTWIVDDQDQAITLQRKIDYVFGSTPLDRLKPQHREAALAAITGEADGEVYDPGEVCPTFSKREYFISAANKILFLMAVSLLTPFFGLSPATLDIIFWADMIAFPVVTLIMVGYYLYAQHEAKVYSQCSSCQTASQIGVAGKRALLALALAIVAGVVLKVIAQ